MAATQSLRRWIVSRFCPLSALDYAALLAASIGVMDEVLRYLG